MSDHDEQPPPSAARQPWAYPGDAGHGDAGHGDAGHGDAGYGVAGYGVAGHGVAGHGVAGHGDTGQGDIGQGDVGQGDVGQGDVGGHAAPGSHPPAASAAAGQYDPGAPADAAGVGGVGGGRGVLAVLAVFGLMVVSAIGGGVAGAALYSQAEGDDGGPGGTQIVDGPQLDYASLASISSDVRPSVVSIQVGGYGGSGVVISEEGHIITNAHVVQDAGGSEIAVRFTSGETAPATLVGADERSDVAVIRAQDVTDVTPAAVGDSDEVLVGDTVLAIGSPLGYEGSVTQGIVSARDRTLSPQEPGAPTLSGLLQTDAAINSGNSGGPLVNLDGEVVGINTAIAAQQPQSGFMGIGFAVPSNRAMDIADQLIAGDEVNHPFLGVSVTAAQEGGAVIGQVVDNSPADEGGLQEGDVVVRFGDRSVTDSNDLVAAVQAASVGETVQVEYVREDQTTTTTVTLAEAPD